MACELTSTQYLPSLGINDEVKVLRRSERLLQKKALLPAEAKVVIQHRPKIPRKHLQDSENKAKTKIRETFKSRNKKNKTSSAIENASRLAQKQNATETSEKNIDETNSRFKNQLSDKSRLIDNLNQLTTLIEKSTLEWTKIVSRARSEPQTSCSHCDSASTSNTAISSTSNFCSETSNQPVTSPRLSELTVNQVKSTNSEFTPNNNLADFCQDKENIQTYFTHTVSSGTQNITSMSLCAPTRNKTADNFQASIAKYSNIYKDAVSILREECNKYETKATYRFSRFDNGMYQCQVDLCDKYYFAIGTGRTEEDAQHSAAIAMLDQWPKRNLFGNTVGMLQELCMRLGWPLPTYRFLNQWPSTFSCSCSLAHMTVDLKWLEYEEIEQGRSKKIAKRLAALKLLIKSNESL